jgi:hypothetical protein
MPPIVAKSERVIFNGYDLSCYVNMVGSDIERELKSQDVFCTDGAKTNKKGLLGVETTLKGFNEFSPTAETIINQIFQNAVVSDDENLVLYSLGGGFTGGGAAVMLNLNNAKYSIDPIEAGELLLAQIVGSGTQSAGKVALAHGVWLMSQVVTGPVNGSSYDNGAGFTGYVAQAHNTNANGAATVKIQHSSNNSTWVDLVTFNAIPQNSAAPQAINTGANVNRYLRAIVTSIGGSTAKVHVAIKPGHAG